jgi:F-box-like
MYVFLLGILQQPLTRCFVGRAIQIDVLPDDVLLGIFDFCANQDVAQDPRFLLPIPTKKDIEAWQPLVHVCRRWRTVVFGSSRRLKVQLVCTAKTPARETLDVWPALPLSIRGYGNYPTESVDNIIAVLERSDRVCQINLMDVPSSLLEELSAAMQKPFLELTHLELSSYDEAVSVLPDSFLGGSAPRLQFLWLDGVPFPGLPGLLSSATHLVHLHLCGIPHSGYISPEAMVTSLSTLTNLKSLWLEFQSPLSCPDRASRRPPPLRRSALRVLTSLRFKGVSEYLEDFVARIDTPRLLHLSITFFNQIAFDTPQFIQFISRTPKLKLDKAHVAFEVGAASVNFSSQTSGYGELDVKVSCKESDWQLSSLEQVCTSTLPPLSTLEGLFIHETSYPQPQWQDNVENALWLELLHPFTAVKNLYLSKEFAPRVAPALQELVGGRTTEVLPTLQNIFLEGHPSSSGPVQEGIGQFVATRQVTRRPVAVSRWDRWF